MADEVLCGSVVCGGDILEDGQPYTAYGIAVCSEIREITISNISPDSAFVRNLLDIILSGGVAMCHVDEIVQDELCGRSFPLD